MKNIRRTRGAGPLSVTAAVMVALGAPPAAASSPEISLEGYLRQAFSFNLNNPRDLETDDFGQISMARTTLRLDGNFRWREMTGKVIYRLDKEYETDYLRRLDARGAYAHQADRLVEAYNNSEIREAYVDIPVSRRVTTRLGKQQLVWGESDFFAANDLIHGFNYTWRSFLEAENEELRKPLIMARFDVGFPEVGGNLQLFLRPGWDRREDIGNSYDIFGGRWANQPNKTVDFLGVAPGLPFFPYDFDHPDAAYDEETFGVRWTQILDSGLSYSLMYLRHHNPNPVHNSPLDPFKGRPVLSGAFGPNGSFIFPVVDTVGFTLSNYFQGVDAVLSAEVAYTFDKPYNYSTVRGVPILDAGFQITGGEGSAGIKEEDTLSFMLRADKQVDLTGTFLRTSRPSFLSVQVFNTWIPGYSESDNLIRLVGYDARERELQSLITGILGLNYANDRINPQLAVGWDLTNGGGFLIPSVTFAYGDNWRILLEADLFFADGKSKKNALDMEGSARTRVFGYFDRNDQFYARITYNF